MKLRIALLLATLATPAYAQWQTPAGTIPMGRGSGVTGFSTVAGSGGTGAKCLIDTAPPTFGLCGTAGAIQVGVTQVLSGTNSAPLWNNAGVLANSAFFASWVNYQNTGAVSQRSVQDKLLETRSVRDYGAVCDGVTDDTAAFQAAIDSVPNPSAFGMWGGEILVPWTINGCRFLGTLNVSGRFSITLRGVRGMGANGSMAFMQYGGAGARFIDARDSHGFGLININLQYNNAAFSGILIDAGGLTPAQPGPVPPATFGSASDNLLMENVKISTSVDPGTATMLNINQAQIVTLDNVAFSGGNPAIQGADILAHSATTALLKNVKFLNSGGVPIRGCGDSWHFLNATFEPLSAAVGGGIGALQNTSPAIDCRGVRFTNPWMGDSLGGGGTWITYFGSGLTVTGGLIATNATGQAISIASPSEGINIKGVVFQGGLNAINFNNGSVSGCDVSANTFDIVTNNIVGLTNTVNCNLEGNSPSISQATNGQIRVGLTGSDPIFRTMSGDATLNSTGVLTVANNAISNAKLRDSGALTVIGRSANSVGDPADIAAPSGSNRVLRETSSTLAFGNIPFAVNVQTFCPSGCTTTIAAGGSGTYTPNSNLIYAQLECVAGGGGGGGVNGAASQIYGGGGGGSGSYSRSTVAAAVIGASQTVNIGAGGAGGVAAANGAAGGASSIGAIITTNGGGGGQFSATGVQLGIGGTGGAVGTGQIVMPGNGGAGGSFNATASNIQIPSGIGAPSFFGGGANSAFVAANSNGNAGQRGGGGSGAYTTTATGPTGGAGGPGYCVATEYING